MHKTLHVLSFISLQTKTIDQVQSKSQKLIENGARAKPELVSIPIYTLPQRAERAPPRDSLCCFSRISKFFVMKSMFPDDEALYTSSLMTKKPKSLWIVSKC